MAPINSKKLRKLQGNGDAGNDRLCGHGVDTGDDDDAGNGTLMTMSVVAAMMGDGIIEVLAMVDYVTIEMTNMWPFPRWLQ